MKKFLLHIVSLIICLSFAFQTSYVLVSSIESDTEVVETNESKTEEEKFSYFINKKKLIYTEYIIHKEGYVISSHKIVNRYENSFFRGSYFKLHKLHNSYLI